MYVHDGRLWTTKPGRIDEVIDIQGKFVIPPLGEAHNHWVEPKLFDAYNAEYLRDGVFYVRDMANAPYIVDQFRDRVNLPTSVDFVSALQGFTGPRAHPLEVLLGIQQFGILPKEWSAPDFEPCDRCPRGLAGQQGGGPARDIARSVRP
ncbi:MAG TPA: hypothetical protein VFA39_02100 [Steroidobacteraceae bacterium]|nr:hypothetical protein [Steroidobacteraceae bacterium]